MQGYTPAIILISGFLFDLILGDPNYRYHPVRVIGRLTDLLHNWFKGRPMNMRFSGVLLALLTILISVSAYFIIIILLNLAHPILAMLMNIYFVYSLIALKDLFNHCGPVIEALRSNGLIKARESVSMIVGRDVNSLDENGVIRSAIETLAENFVDGFLSPVFWFCIGSIIGPMIDVEPVLSGVVFLIIFKVASTLDSMVGHKTEELIEIGWAGARLDDLLNFIPARLSLILLFFGAMLSGLRPLSGLTTAMRDRLKHDSPNSAHPESFVAGAIRRRLGGPVRYPEGLKEKPWLGAEFPDPELKDIRGVIRLLMITALLVLFLSSFVIILRLS
ncbi:MAG: cobalamin biosynthesis protein CobD [Deltaproteobacteria bacterium]|nr:cobalamin biosynthesis protein CobD [Deltaproteobacteria bacterium]